MVGLPFSPLENSLSCGPFGLSLELPLQRSPVSVQCSPPPNPHQDPWVVAKHGLAKLVPVPTNGGRGKECGGRGGV